MLIRTCSHIIELTFYLVFDKTMHITLHIKNVKLDKLDLLDLYEIIIIIIIIIIIMIIIIIITVIIKTFSIAKIGKKLQNCT